MRSEPGPSGTAVAVRRVGAGALLAAVVAAGVGALIYFVTQLLRPGDLNVLSLPLVAFVAGVAATFNPCGMPALPGFLTFGGQGGRDEGVWRRGSLSLSAALGAMTVVIAIGLVVAAAGTGAKGLLAPYTRWVQLAIGLVLIGLALAHLAGRTSSLPLMGRVMGLGSRACEEAIGRPTTRGSYLFGAGFVAVGVG